MLTELARQYQAKAQADESPRTRSLALLDAYYHGCQYDFLPRAWHETTDHAGNPVPFRSRRPSTILPVPKLLVDSLVRALWGAHCRPRAGFAKGSPEDNEFLTDIIADAKLLPVMREASRRALTIGTGLVVWKLQDGRLRAEAWDAKYAEPTFKPGAFPELERLDYRFKFKREERDSKTGLVREIEYWHREEISGPSGNEPGKWIIYQDAPVSVNREPEWKVAAETEHKLGFCPAVWFTVGERGQTDFDGSSVFESLLCLFDDLNYTASQQARALHYNLDPQTVLSGVSEGDVETLLKGGPNTWCLPKEAKAELLESTGTYVDQANSRMSEIRKWCMDIAAVVINDPEKISGGQSGSALELLCQPMVSHVEDLRDQIGDGYIRLLEQILRAFDAPELAPNKFTIDVRDGRPRPNGAREIGRVTLTWGPQFPRTAQDATTAADAASKLVAAGIVSRAAAARFVAPYVGIEDPDEDQKLVDQDEARQDKRVESITAATAARSRYADGLDETGAETGGNDAP